MCRVNSFMGCVMLETFGLFIGWFNMILMIILAFLSIMGIVVFIIELNGIGIAICIVILIASFLIACVSKELIRGVEYRDYTRIRMFRNLCILSVVLAIVQLLTAIARIGQPSLQPQIGAGLLSSGATLLIQVYIFICIDSLFKKIGEETLQQNYAIDMHQGPYIINCHQQPQNPYSHAHMPVYASVPTAPKY